MSQPDDLPSDVLEGAVLQGNENFAHDYGVNFVILEQTTRPAMYRRPLPATNLNFLSAVARRFLDADAFIGSNAEPFVSNCPTSGPEVRPGFPMFQTTSNTSTIAATEWADAKRLLFWSRPRRTPTPVKVLSRGPVGCGDSA